MHVSTIITIAIITTFCSLENFKLGQSLSLLLSLSLPATSWSSSIHVQSSSYGDALHSVVFCHCRQHCRPCMSSIFSSASPVSSTQSSFSTSQSSTLALYHYYCYNNYIVDILQIKNYKWLLIMQLQNYTMYTDLQFIL